jgi:competence protein ComEA
MKQIFMVIIGLMLTSSYVLWPVQEKEPEMVYVMSPEVKSYQVELTGAVVFPGVYRFYEPITIDMLIHYAGGFLPDADQTRISMGQIIDRHYILDVKSIHQEVVLEYIKININKAGFKELISVPFISETIAASIIIYREQNGPFFHLDELIHVKHIGPATLEKIKPYISLG